MKKHQWIVGFVALAVLAALFLWGRHRVHFDFAVFWAQIKQARWPMIALGLACIYSAYGFRSVRWAFLLRHNHPVSPFALLGTQVIGFTAVALIGRVADPVRPYLVSQKTGLPLSSQIAVYIVERLFDFGSLALIISSVILLAPAGSLPHPEIVRKAGYGGLAVTLCAGLFLTAVRLAGGAVAAFLERVFSLASPRLGAAIGHKVRTFRTGLDTMRSFADFAAAAALSLSMWALIACSYLVTLRAFTASPQLAHMSLPQCILLLAVSGSVSVFQLPVLGWFSQIAFVAAALASFFGASAEASTAGAATLLLVTFLGIVPVGLIWAQAEHVSLRGVAAESEHAEEELSEKELSIDGLNAGALDVHDRPL